MSKQYSVERTNPTMYINEANQTIQGFIVFVRLTDYDELHEIRVPSLDPKVVSKAIDKLVANRDALAGLNGE